MTANKLFAQALEREQMVSTVQGELVHAVIAAMAFASLYIAAKHRFTRRERRGPADIGLD